MHMQTAGLSSCCTSALCELQHGVLGQASSYEYSARGFFHAPCVQATKTMPMFAPVDSTTSQDDHCTEQDEAVIYFSEYERRSKSSCG